MEKVTLSVIIPAYNAEKTISQALDSAASQTMHDKEIIVIDDGSADRTAEVVSRYSGIKLISTPNRGSGAARNLGIEEASGAYVAFLDADDKYPDSGVLSGLVSEAKKHDAPACGGSFLIWENGYITSDFPERLSGYRFEDDATVKYSDYQFDYGYHRFIYSKEILISNSIRFPDLLRYQDPPFMVRALDACGSFRALKMATYLYRSEPDKINWNERRARDLMRGLTDELRFSSEKGYSKLHALVAERAESEFAEIIMNAVSGASPACRRDFANLYYSIDPELIGRDISVLPAPIDDLMWGNAEKVNEYYSIRREYGKLVNTAEYRLSKLIVSPLRTIKRGIRRLTGDKSFK